MKKLLLATTACFALAFPAMAQSNQAGTSSNQKAPDTNSQMSNEARASSGSQMHAASDNGQSRMIEPSSLDEERIRQVQMNLNKAGFSAGSVDGIWGEETRQALRNYQQQKQLPGNGQLNEQTLAELGITGGDNSQRSSQEHQTTGSASGNAAQSSRPNVNIESHPQQQNGSSPNSQQR